MFELFSERSRRVLVLAQEEARLLRHHRIGVEDLLLGLLHDSGSLAARALGFLGISLEAARARIAATPSARPVDRPPPFTGPAKRALERAHQVSLAMDETTVTTKHLLLGLLDVDDASSSQLLGSFGVTAPHARSALDALPGVEPDLPRDRPRPRAYFVGAGDDIFESEAMVTGPVRGSPPPELPAALVAELETRYELLPVHRIRRDADFWALRRVEEEHVERLARRHLLER
ncbi:MAG: Clp protease N-terminal domain-containing protein [Acidimicrobiales bacterium]